MSYLWDWYSELCQTNALSYAEIKAWSEVTQRPLLYWEPDFLMQLDRLFRKVQYDRARNTKDKGRQPRGSRR